MRSWTIAFSVGVVAASLLPRLPPWPLALAALAGSILLQRWQSLRLAGAVLCGAAWLCCCGQWHLQQRWPEPPFPRDVWVEGTVWSIPLPGERGQRFRFRLDRVCLRASLVDCDFAQLPRDGRTVLLTLYEPLMIVPGERWRWKLRLRPPHGFANPGGFDYEAWLMQQGIDGTGYVRDSAMDQPLESAGLRRLFERARMYCIGFIENGAGGRLRYSQLLRALAVGDGSEISDEEWQLFADTGTTHLLVISGSHVALVCLWLYATCYWLSSRSAWLLRKLPAPHWAAAMALAGAWVYTGLAGFSLPALRALVMAALTLAAILLRRHCSSMNNLGFALAVILAFDPLAAQNPGFWLSFIAVAVLLRLAQRDYSMEIPASALQRIAGQLGRFVVLQWQLAVALLPVLLLYFQQTSVLAPVVNLLAIPLIGWLVVPLTLGALLVGLIWPWMGSAMLLISDHLLHGLMQGLQFSTTLLPVSALVLPAVNAMGMALLSLAAIAVVWAPRRWQRLAALAILPLGFLLRPPALPPGAVRMSVLDVGQGLAVIVSTRSHHLLYDAGPYYSANFDAGSDVVLPVLRRYNVRRLDTVMISHADLDHAGGLSGIVDAFPEAHYLSPEPALFPAELGQALCRQGGQWQWDGVWFRILHPDGKRYDDNNGSCVLLIEAGGRQLLLTGDIERGVESMLLRRYPQLRAEVVVAPHHGSRSSSSPAFVRRLAPDYVVFSSGYQNRFNHPAADVVQRYREQGSQHFITARSGAIVFEIGADGLIDVGEQRRRRRRFWAPVGPPQ